MTTTEFSNEFDILFNSINSNAGQPLDEYEKSVLLTIAQEEIVRKYYDPKFNKAQEGFEMSEKRRRQLDSLITNASNSSPISSSADGLAGANSVFFNINSDVMYIINERLTIKSKLECYNGNVINVKPVTHDYINEHQDNPFRRPDEKVAWRMDYNKVKGTKSVEIFYPSTYQPSVYHYRYLRMPKPIILVDLLNIDSTLTIRGLSAITESELSSEFHTEVLHKSIELAKLAQSDPSVQLNMNRNAQGLE